MLLKRILTMASMQQWIETKILTLLNIHLLLCLSATHSCCFCDFNHTLEDCRLLTSCPYQEGIQFLASKDLGYLSNKHIAKDRPQRKLCKFTNCLKKYPTVLKTQLHERLNGKTSAGSAENVNSSATQVHNGMVSTHSAWNH